MLTQFRQARIIREGEGAGPALLRSCVTCEEGEIFSILVAPAATVIISVALVLTQQGENIRAGVAEAVRYLPVG
tara:strand:- start:726 stop:947 length:222 start_codon:yes stop_codon:yes gene_type:complete